ncbi:MAG: DNA gyrase inhibitor YacG [Planctomycetaceae bacterium]|nr:MAG: DNA gyrase inhibitor YacG [Planctomycetaceae bacterium]
MNSNPRTPQSKTRLTCPTCGRGFLFEASTAVPFCSERCRLIDLGRWLEEDIGVPFEGDSGEADVDRRDPDSED